MSQFQLDAYFARIGMDTPSRPTLAVLQEIQTRHIATVPFENLDIINGRVPLQLDTQALFDKIVSHHRGGICYELNLLLADALDALGYRVTLLSGIHPKYGDAFDHAFLLVTACDCDVPWIVDVGFADNFCKPLPFPSASNAPWVSDGRDEYRFRSIAPKTYELIRRRNGSELLMFTFTTEPRTRKEYQPRCDWYATSPQSRFTQGPLVCIDRPGGRISLTMNRVLNTYKDERVRTDINSKEEFEVALWEIFKIEVESTG